ncbi:VOC family protein [Oenococcus oeni]|uniref:VOC family protein n=1 Tax=Oenococcus oeni TaxID=1247 RepID=UPI0029350EF5|nr:VOC family protein [Oenococcus oeni]WOC53467.1 VOC family protein [Oenococcus oeni]
MNKKGIISHIEIYVSDLKASKRFWSWLLFSQLGYKVYQQWDKGISFILNETYLVFVQADQDKLLFNYNRTHIGLNHLAFYASSKQMVDDIRTAIQNKNYKELYSDRYPFAGGPDHYALYFEDPDRIKVEIVAAD